MALSPLPAIDLGPGVAYPLGAHRHGDGGLNFALVAPHAQAVWLCLFDTDGSRELARHQLPACTDGVWHGHLADAGPGLVYGYRVDGPWAPERGQRFNVNKVLLDPYARAVCGRYLAQPGFLEQADDGGPDPFDNAAIALKAKVTDETQQEAYDWGDDTAPRVAPADTVLYELHVKGFTQLHPGVPAPLRGSYAGLAQPAVLDYLAQLGVTSLSLMPVHLRADELRLQQLGLSNYWGYASIGFFAPEPRYWSGTSGTPLSEFRDMVKALHRRGIEVLLDVVYNHTAETDEHGPTLGFRGIDNQLYYHLRPDQPALYENWTGCGNCLNLAEPRVLQLVMDSLRYWVEAMHVDGFRFDLAPALARGAHGFSCSAAFLAAVRQDPVLAKIKLIAEPWDIGPGGYQLGNFPPGWLEWNDSYRDTMRAYWLRRDAALGDFAQHFAGSSALFHKDGRRPSASVNFISAHDGFTLRDLVSYDHKHNEANGEDNRDGADNNLSWNGGAEGPTGDATILQRRAGLQRALLATLLFSQGTPMLLAGDEIGHSQGGNNNAYCQDNAVCWFDWEHADQALLDATRQLIALRRRFPALRHDHWYDGAVRADGSADIAWRRPDGGALDAAAWAARDATAMAIAIVLHPDPAQPRCLLLINGGEEARTFQLPPGRWRLLFDSSRNDPRREAEQGNMVAPAHALLLLTDDTTEPSNQSRTREPAHDAS